MATIEVSGMDRMFVGGGAEHTPESMRRLICTATGGAEGVGGITDMWVRPLAIPGQGVRVAVGSCLIRSRFTGGDTQTYQATAFRQQELEIAANETNQDRYDLIVIRVEDGFAAGSTWPKPAEADRAEEQYIYARVIPGVPASTTRLQTVPGQADTTGYALARVKIPAFTGTITLAQITDLRKVAQPRRSEVVYARPRASADEGAQVWLTTTVANGGEYFPGGAGFANEFTVDVPEWATRLVIDASWMSVSQIGTPHGKFWVEFGDEWRDKTWPNKQHFEYRTEHFGFNAAATTDEKMGPWQLMDEVSIAAKLRGKRVTFVFKAGNTSVFAPEHKTWMGAYGGLGMRLTFAEQAIAPDLI